MPDSYYQPGPARGERVNDLFARIAPRYDLINDLQSFGLHRLWKRRLVNLAELKPGERALDVCCGTGDIAFALARCGASVIGLDFSEPMLAVALSREGTEKTAKIKLEFIKGDAQELPFCDESFDVVTIGYGLRNLPDWERGLEEMWRVTKPGGRLLVLDFGKPESAVLRRIFFAYLRSVVPIFGEFFCGDSATHAYILESLKSYPAQKGVADKMRRLACEEIQVVNLLGGVMSINVGRK